MPADPAGANAAILSAAGGADILWLETAHVRPGVYRLKVLNPDTAIVCYSEDDMMNPRNRTVWLQRSMPLIDLWATTKSLNMRRRSGNAETWNMLFVNNSYDTDIHRPVDVGPADIQTFGAPVSLSELTRRGRHQSSGFSGVRSSVGERLGDCAAARELED